MKHLSGSRKAEHLSEPVSRQLSRYALAATAAGVGLLATVPAHAKIVYTPANVTIPFGFYPVDLNHDGINDFSFYKHQEAHTSAASGYFLIEPLAKNEVMLNQLSNARALPAGVVIGPHDPFRPAGEPLMAAWSSFSGQNHFRGPWANGGKGVKNRYLGLKFHYKGGTHFGWARLSVSGLLYATLTGYAYETILGKAIIAGATKGPDDAAPSALNKPTPEPATLGMLALGAPGLSIWRREEPVAATSDRS